MADVGPQERRNGIERKFITRGEIDNTLTLPLEERVLYRSERLLICPYTTIKSNRVSTVFSTDEFRLKIPDLDVKEVALAQCLNS
jgi:hypothetical protein